MKGGGMGEARPPNASSEGSKRFIHRNKASKPRTARVTARFDPLFSVKVDKHLRAIANLLQDDFTVILEIRPDAFFRAGETSLVWEVET